MKTYRLEAKLLGPLALKRDRQSERSETLRYVPGTTVRGALANTYLQQHGEADETFRCLFLDESHCRFGPLDPGQHCFPTTVTACKRHPKEHPKVDQLWYRAAQYMTGNRVAAAVTQQFRQCPDCGADMKPYVGFWEDREGEVRDHNELVYQVSAHVGIDRLTATAAQGILYTLEAIAPSDRDVDLRGWVQLSDTAHAALQRLLEAEDGIVYFGHHRTRGYGKVRLAVLDDDPADSLNRNGPSDWETWSEALIRFVDAASSRDTADSAAAGGATPRLDPSQDYLFSISLPDGALLVDYLLRYTADPAAMVDWLPPLPEPGPLLPAEQRFAATPPEGGTLRCVTAMTNQQLLRGWHAAHGLPRQDEWMVNRGAVYLYWFRGTPEQRAALNDRLATLAESRIGLRSNEGYGRVTISDPIHSRLALQETLQ